MASVVPQRLASRFAVIGVGKMVEAMIGGLMSTGIQPPSDVSVFDSNHERMQLFENKFGVVARLNEVVKI